ncbi:caskin-1 isoform X3 [Lucilia sericata]|uniref:caskin-1 isoform X3 n=1 Tax=Lucilia sericata TaxID=13632 RepID=UPI0018A8072B|nr:caskin-1 isoform X3 [Lucilia sericata]XP_037820468.1 caskin-1 isoform X3 [Lucilia sericata]
MHRSLKPHAQAKKITKVAPPALPGDPVPQQQTSQSAYQQQIPLYRLGGSISGAAGKVQLEDGIIMSSMVSSPSLEEGGFNLPREPTVALRIKDEINEYSSAMSTSGSSQTSATATAASKNAQATAAAAAGNPLLGSCPPSLVPCPPPVFCATLREPLTHKAAVYYHQQLALQEDQGIDLTQSPGRDSPGSSSGSAGSGSRHSTASLDSGRASSYLTGVSGAGSIRSSGGGGALSSPRCSSLSSCSIGSMDRQRNEELIIDWLMEMKYEEYAQLFITAGYDLPTIARMTPEDLTAIGIKNPHHRERIKQRIDKLQVLDNLPHFVPGSIEEWLQLLRLEEYIQPLLDQNYKTVRDVTQVTWEDLEDIGIVKLGHQKKILLAIKRVKDIISGKWNPGGSNPYNQQVRQPRGKSLESLEDIHDNSTRSHLTFSHYTTTDYGHFAHPSQLQQHQQALQQQQHLQQAALMAGGAGNLPPGAAQRMLSNPATMNWRRSYDDGDITPTNDAAARELMYEEGGGTLPRQQRGILQRAVLNTMPPLEHHHYMNAAAAAEYVCHAGGLGPPTTANVPPGANAGVSSNVGAGNVLDSSSLTNPYLTGSPMTAKKIAPEPPRRHCSIRNSRTLSQDGSQMNPSSVAAHGMGSNMYYGAGGGMGPGVGPSMHPHAAYLQQQASQPIYANYATIQQTTAEIHCEKFHDNKSNSSIDSIDTIPFANENTGTIKQRLLNRQELTGGGGGATGSQGTTGSSHLHSSSSSSSSSSTNTIANIAHSFHSLKSSSSLHDASLIRSESIGSTASGGSAGLSLLRSPTLQYPPVNADSAPSLAGLGTDDNSAAAIVASVDSNPIETSAITSNTAAAGVNVVGAVAAGAGQKVSVNVLNDIGNMLANLTDELDAMLEEEKRVGLNIDSE